MYDIKSWECEINDAVNEYLQNNCIDEPTCKAFRKGVIKGISLVGAMVHRQQIREGVSVCLTWLDTEDGSVLSYKAQREHCERILSRYTNSEQELQDALNEVFDTLREYNSYLYK